MVPRLIVTRYDVQFDDGFDTTLVVDGVPVIDESKRERLLNKFCKEFGRKGVSIKPEDVYMPWNDAKGKSKGYLFLFSLALWSLSQRLTCCSYAFVDFRTVEDANLALSALNNHPFDSKHTFKLNRFTDIEGYANMDESYSDPKYEEFKPKVWLVSRGY